MKISMQGWLDSYAKSGILSPTVIYTCSACNLGDTAHAAFWICWSFIILKFLNSLENTIMSWVAWRERTIYKWRDSITVWACIAPCPCDTSPYSNMHETRNYGIRIYLIRSWLKLKFIFLLCVLRQSEMTIAGFTCAKNSNIILTAARTSLEWFNTPCPPNIEMLH